MSKFKYHKFNHQKSHILMGYGFFLLISIGFEVLAGLLWFIWGLGWLGLAAHVISIILLAVAWQRQALRSTVSQLAPSFFFGFILALCVPLIGYVGILLILSIVSRTHRRTKKFELLEEMAPDVRIPYRTGLREAIVLTEQEATLEPFVDTVMRPGDEGRKAMVIYKLAHHPTPEGVDLLKKALGDESAEVKLYAANALVYIEDCLAQKINELDLAAKRYGRAADYRRLGDHWYRYATSGLLHESQKIFHLENALEAYQTSLNINSGRSRVAVRQGQTLLELNRFSEAKRFLDEALVKWEGEAHLLFLWAQACYYLGEYEQIPAAFEKVSVDAFSEDGQDVVAFWKEEL